MFCTQVQWSDVQSGSKVKVAYGIALRISGLGPNHENIIKLLIYPTLIFLVLTTGQHITKQHVGVLCVPSRGVEGYVTT